MQQLVLLTIGLLIVPVASSASASSVARLWLQSHTGEPTTDDQLEELKNANPEAFTIVNALLAKRSLAHSSLPESDRGPEAFTRLMTPRHGGEVEPSVSMPFAEVQPAGQHDWINYKPEDSARKDDAMVDSLLAEVAQLKGKKIGFLSKHRHVEEESEPNPLEEAAEDFGVDLHPTTAPVQVSNMQDEEQDELSKKTNSYLEGIDLSGDMPEVTSHKMNVEGPQKTLAGNDLKTFSWDGFSPADFAKPRATPEATPEAKPEAQPKDNPNPLGDWLGIAKKASASPKVTVEQPEQPPKPENHYVVDLLGDS